MAHGCPVHDPPGVHSSWFSKLRQLLLSWWIRGREGRDLQPSVAVRLILPGSCEGSASGWDAPTGKAVCQGEDRAMWPPPMAASRSASWSGPDPRKHSLVKVRQGPHRISERTPHASEGGQLPAYGKTVGSRDRSPAELGPHGFPSEWPRLLWAERTLPRESVMSELPRVTSSLARAEDHRWISFATSFMGRKIEWACDAAGMGRGIQPPSRGPDTAGRARPLTRLPPPHRNCPHLELGRRLSASRSHSSD